MLRHLRWLLLLIPVILALAFFGLPPSQQLSGQRPGESAQSPAGDGARPAAAGQGPAQARQGPPPAPVRYTEARVHKLRRVVQLPASIEPAAASLVASEVAGLVVELPAREGRRVSRGEPLARLRQTTIELRLQAAEAEIVEAEARERLAERELHRARQLFGDQVFSQQQLDSAQFEQEARKGRVEQLRADIARLRDDLERSVVRAPFDGVVVREHTEAGQWVAVGGPIVELHRVDALDVLADVPERYFADLRLGAPVTVTLDSLPDLEVEGRVTAVVPRADPQARTFPVKIRIANPGARIGAGMLARVTLPVGEPEDTLVVPKDAVVIQGADRLVYRISDDGTIEIIPVTTGAGAGDWVAVEGPIEPGAKVVTRGNERLRPGQPVAGEPLDYTLP